MVASVFVNRTNVYAALVVAAMASSACKDSKLTHAQASAANLQADTRRAREAVQRTVDGFLPKIRELVTPVTAPVLGNDAPALRSTLVGFTTPGGAMTLYPTSFVTVTNREGVSLARDIANESDDRMKGMDLRVHFACVRQALEGREGTCVGELPAVGAMPSRVLLVAVAPIKNPANEVIGTVSAGLTYGSISRMVDATLRGSIGDAVFWTGLRWRGRVMPSGTDRDVAPRWLVPASLVREIRAADAQRIETAGGEHFWPFVQDNRGWAGALAALPSMPETQIVLFRSEANQR